MKTIGGSTPLDPEAGTPATIDQAKVCDALPPRPSSTDTVVDAVPARLGVPEIRPDAALIDSPAGRPLAAYVSASPSGSLADRLRLVAMPTTSFRIAGKVASDGLWFVTPAAIVCVCSAALPAVNVPCVASCHDAPSALV